MVKDIEFLRQGLRALETAARLTRKVQGSMNPQRMTKGDRSPVTLADYASQAVVCRMLATQGDSIPVVAEEGADLLRKEGKHTLLPELTALVQEVEPQASAEQVLDWIEDGHRRSTPDRFWTLDPVDGTKGFLRGDQYAISLGLIEKGEVVLGILAVPNLAGFSEKVSSGGYLFAAAKGHGAWQYKSAEDTEPERLLVKGAVPAAEARFCESYESAHSDHSWSGRIANKLKIQRDPLRIDSQAKYAMLALGGAEIYLRLPTKPGYVEKIWDHAGGSIIVREAGLDVFDVDGKALDFGQGHRLERNRGVVVTLPSLHDEVLGAIREAEAELDAPDENG